MGMRIFRLPNASAWRPQFDREVDVTKCGGGPDNVLHATREDASAVMSLREACPELAALCAAEPG